MDRQEKINVLRQVVGEYLAARALELVDLLLIRQGRELSLRVLVDKPEGGISLGECASLNSEIGNLLDEKGVMEESYVLEVSSPGLDRPLSTKADFLRCVGREARFFMRTPLEGKLEFEGRIEKADDTHVYVYTRGATVALALADIAKAKQII